MSTTRTKAKKLIAIYRCQVCGQLAGTQSPQSLHAHLLTAPYCVEYLVDAGMMMDCGVLFGTLHHIKTTKGVIEIRGVARTGRSRLITERDDVIKAKRLIYDWNTKFKAWYMSQHIDAKCKIHPLTPRDQVEKSILNYLSTFHLTQKTE